MEVYFYQAECGDAARLRFIGENGKYSNILIDAGYERTFTHVLEDEIESIIANKEKIDLWSVSHIHDDHIGGVIKYIEKIQRGELKDVVNTWLYNPPRNYPVILSNKVNNEDWISGIKSIGQGDELYKYLSNASKLLGYDITEDSESINVNGLKMTFLSPSGKKLFKLRNKYKNPLKSLERHEMEEISIAVTSKSYDYSVKVEEFDLGKWKEDASIENGSSITMLTDYNGIKILWLADGHPSDFVLKLKKIGYSPQNKLRCNIVKVVHHGSKGNNSNELYDLIDCTNYVFSVDGVNGDRLPTKESMVRILRNKNRPKNSEYTFYFTYDNAILRDIFKVDGADVFSKWKFKVDCVKGSKFLKFNF